jgi:hypothetical protein
MRMRLRGVRQEAYLLPCPNCAAGNGVNARRCWQCECELPPPDADDALAAALRAWPPDRSTPRVAGHRETRSVEPDVAPLHDADDEPTTPRPTVDLEVGADDAALERARQVRERFGLLVDGAPARTAQRRRLALTAGLAAAFVLVAVAGYPVYRGAERVAMSPTELHHLRFPSAAIRVPAAPVTPAQAAMAPVVERREIAAAKPTPAADARPLPPAARPAVAVPADPRTTLPATRRSTTHVRQAEPPLGASRAAAQRRVARVTHGAPRTAHVAARRTHEHGPVLMASDVSLHDAAMGR